MRYETIYLPSLCVCVWYVVFGEILQLYAKMNESNDSRTRAEYSKLVQVVYVLLTHNTSLFNSQVFCP